MKTRRRGGIASFKQRLAFTEIRSRRTASDWQAKKRRRKDDDGNDKRMKFNTDSSLFGRILLLAALLLTSERIVGGMLMQIWKLHKLKNCNGNKPFCWSSLSRAGSFSVCLSPLLCSLAFSPYTLAWGLPVIRSPQATTRNERFLTAFRGGGGGCPSFHSKIPRIHENIRPTTK